MNRIIFLVLTLLAAPLYGQIKFSELPTKTAGASTASQIFFPLVEMDGTPSTFRMSATELSGLVGAAITSGDKGVINVSEGGVWSFDPVVVTPYSLTLLDNANAANWRSELGLGSAATSSASEFAAVDHTHIASDIASGILATGRLGSGTASASNFLRGDSTWSTILPSIALGGNTVTANTPVINAAQIWNNGSIDFNGIYQDIQNSASGTGSRLARLDVGGVEQFSVNAAGQVLADGAFAKASGAFGWSSADPPTIASVDTLLYRDSSSAIGQRSGITAQTYRLYKTWTSFSPDNFERATLDWQGSPGTFRIGTQKGGSGGTAVPMSLITDDTVRVTIGATDGITTFAADQIRVTTSKTPSSASDTGVAGTICWDSSYIYVCTATNTWKRVAIATW